VETRPCTAAAPSYLLPRKKPSNVIAEKKQEIARIEDRGLRIAV
jgi:hypothetical protein